MLYFSSQLPQGSWDRCFICYIADLSIALGTTIATYADTAVLATHTTI